MTFTLTEQALRDFVGLARESFSPLSGESWFQQIKTGMDKNPPEVLITTVTEDLGQIGDTCAKAVRDADAARDDAARKAAQLAEFNDILKYFGAYFKSKANHRPILISLVKALQHESISEEDLAEVVAKLFDDEGLDADNCTKIANQIDEELLVFRAFMLPLKDRMVTAGTIDRRVEVMIDRLRYRAHLLKNDPEELDAWIKLIDSRREVEIYQGHLKRQLKKTGKDEAEGELKEKIDAMKEVKQTFGGSDSRKDTWVKFTSKVSEKEPIIRKGRDGWGAKFLKAISLIASPVFAVRSKFFSTKRSWNYFQSHGATFVDKTDSVAKRPRRS